MKILVISNCPLVETQGSGYIIMNTAKSFRDLGHTVDMISPEQVELFPKMGGKAKLYRMAMGMGLWALKNKKTLQAYQLIVFYGAECYLAVFAIKFLHKLKIPIVLHSNGLEVHNGHVFKKYKQYLDSQTKWYFIDMARLFNYTYKNVDAIIVLSDFNRDFAISDLKIAPEKIYTLEPCLPDVFFETKITDNRKGNIITYCGTWITRKGTVSIENSMPNILRKNPGYTFRIIGVGDGFDKAEFFPTDILDRIEVYPLIKSKEKLMELYAESDIFLFPSFCESFGLVVAEAMFCGCCTITGATGIAAHIKNEKEAMVLQIPEKESVTKALELLISSPDLRNKMSIAAKARVLNLKWSIYTQKLEGISKQIVPQL